MRLGQREVLEEVGGVEGLAGVTALRDGWGLGVILIAVGRFSSMDYITVAVAVGMSGGEWWRGVLRLSVLLAVPSFLS